MSQKVSVVIPAYRGASTIAHTLESIANQTGVDRPEVIVVESSGDAAGDIVARDFPWVTLLREPKRLSAGAARNRGASQAQGDFILFIDQDCVAPSDWISCLVSDLQNPGIHAVGGSIGIANPANLSGAAVYFLEFMHQFPHRGRLESNPPFLLGSNACYRAEVLRSVAYPDRTLAEDVIFTDRVRKAGFGVAYTPEITVLHHNRTGWREFFSYAQKMGSAAADYHAVLKRPWMKPVMRWSALVFPSALAVTPWIGWRLLRGPWTNLCLFLIVSPVCILGNLVWAAAFRRRVLQRRSERAPQDNGQQVR
jgi:glycosyltransferase involved in cell wall biosynthesis